MSNHRARIETDRLRRRRSQHTRRIHEGLWERFGPNLAASSPIRAYLVKERNFNAHQVDGMIADFHGTMDFASLENAGADMEYRPADATPADEPSGPSVQHYPAARAATGASVTPAAPPAPGEVF